MTTEKEVRDWVERWVSDRIAGFARIEENVRHSEARLREARLEPFEAPEGFRPHEGGFWKRLKETYPDVYAHDVRELECFALAARARLEAAKAAVKAKSV